jgi:hypothetical protein
VRGSEEIGKKCHNNEGQGGSGIRVRRGRMRVQDVGSEREDQGGGDLRGGGGGGSTCGGREGRGRTLKARRSGLVSRDMAW